jgi:hypothetical protein
MSNRSSSNRPRTTGKRRMQKVSSAVRQKMPLGGDFWQGRRVMKPRGERNRKETGGYGD